MGCTIEKLKNIFYSHMSDICHKNRISTKRAAHFSTNDWSFDERFNVYILKKIFRGHRLSTLKTHEINYRCKLLTFHPTELTQWHESFIWFILKCLIKWSYKRIDWRNISRDSCSPSWSSIFSSIPFTLARFRSLSRVDCQYKLCSEDKRRL